MLGTDHMGRDVWSRVAFGARTILTLGPISVLVAFLLGIALGLPAGYYGGWIDEVVMRLPGCLDVLSYDFAVYDHHLSRGSIPVQRGDCDCDRRRARVSHAWCAR